MKETPHKYRIKFDEKELELFKKRNVRKILEVCSGDGTNLLFLKKRGFDVMGIESSKKLIEKAKKLLNEKLNKIIHHKIFEKFPFKH